MQISFSEDLACVLILSQNDLIMFGSGLWGTDYPPQSSLFIFFLKIRTLGRKLMLIKLQNSFEPVRNLLVYRTVNLKPEPSCMLLSCVCPHLHKICQKHPNSVTLYFRVRHSCCSCCPFCSLISNPSSHSSPQFPVFSPALTRVTLFSTVIFIGSKNCCYITLNGTPNKARWNEMVRWRRWRFLVRLLPAHEPLLPAGGKA